MMYVFMVSGHNIFHIAECLKLAMQRERKDAAICEV
jgi:hypothetical protein